MIWLTWRHYRIPLLIGAVIIAGSAVALIIIGIKMYTDYHLVQQAICLTTTQCKGPLDDLGALRFSFHDASAILLVIPAMVGMFIGVPLVANEFEFRTFQTQSLPRGRWLAQHLAFLFSTVVVATGILAALVSWCINVRFLPSIVPLADVNERFSVWGFDLSGTVPMAYASFALALGLFCGALFRRTLPAIAVTIAGFAAARFAVAVLWRPHFLPPITRVFPFTFTSSLTPNPFDWQLEQGYVQHGHFIQGAIAVPADCSPQTIGAPLPTNFAQCMQAHGIANYVIYQPFARFWTFQAIETAIFGLAAAGLVWLTFVVVLRRP